MVLRVGVLLVLALMTARPTGADDGELETFIQFRATPTPVKAGKNGIECGGIAMFQALPVDKEPGITSRRVYHQFVDFNKEGSFHFAATWQLDTTGRATNLVINERGVGFIRVDDERVSFSREGSRIKIVASRVQGPPHAAAVVRGPFDWTLVLDTQTGFGYKMRLERTDLTVDSMSCKPQPVRSTH